MLQVIKDLQDVVSDFQRQGTATSSMLNYGYGDLEPHISAIQLRVHYEDHYLGYVNKFNTLLNKNVKRYPKLVGLSAEDVLMTVAGTDFKMLPHDLQEILFLAGQIRNHEFLWKSMTKPLTTKPSARLIETMKKQFGSYDVIIKLFKEEMKQIKGSGWIWLIQDVEEKYLGVVHSKDGECLRCRKDIHPLLICDAWEHAHYLDYRNDKELYIDNFFKVVNWANINERLL